MLRICWCPFRPRPSRPHARRYRRPHARRSPAPPRPTRSDACSSIGATCPGATCPGATCPVRPSRRDVPGPTRRDSTSAVQLKTHPAGIAPSGSPRRRRHCLPLAARWNSPTRQPQARPSPSRPPQTSRSARIAGASGWPCACSSDHTSPTAATRSAIPRSVNACGCTPRSTSSQVHGADTGAPGFGRTA